jgi:hypothetical protein
VKEEISHGKEKSADKDETGEEGSKEGEGGNKETARNEVYRPDHENPPN